MKTFLDIKVFFKLFALIYNRIRYLCNSEDYRIDIGYFSKRKEVQIEEYVWQASENLREMIFDCGKYFFAGTKNKLVIALFIQPNLDSHLMYSTS